MSNSAGAQTRTSHVSSGKAHATLAAIMLCALLTACGGGGGGSGSSGGGSSSGSGGSSGGSGGTGGSGGGGGGTAPTYTVTGTASGVAGSGLILRNNGADDLQVSRDGTFAFATALTSGSSYSVTVATQPKSPTQNCTVDHGSGTVGSANVTDVSVKCVTVPLTLTNSVPVNSATDVLRTANLVLTFSAPLDASRVTTGNVSLQGPSGGVAVTVGTSNNVLTVTPTSQLSPSASYTLTVGTGVQGTGGEALASPVILNFATASIPWTPLIGRTWTMPGDAEGYRCTRIAIPADLYITGFRNTGKNVVRAMVTVSSSTTVTGDYDCSAGSLDNALVYAAGIGTGDFAFPAGFGIHVQAGQFLNLNLHLLNPAADPVTGTYQILAQAGIAADVATPAEMMMLGTFLINIPNDGVTHTASSFFVAKHDQQLLALLPLMQAHGTHQKVSLTPLSTGTTEILLDVDFDPNVQSFYPQSQVFITTSDTLQTVCSYVNNGSGVLNYGESWNNESCFSAAYLAPSAGQSVFFGAIGY